MKFRFVFLNHSGVYLDPWHKCFDSTTDRYHCGWKLPWEYGYLFRNWHKVKRIKELRGRIIWKGFINKAFADCVTLVLSIIAQRFATWVWWVGTVVSGNLLRITSVRPSIPSPYQQQPTTLANNAKKNMRIHDIKWIGGGMVADIVADMMVDIYVNWF